MDVVLVLMILLMWAVLIGMGCLLYWLLTQFDEATSVIKKKKLG